MKFPNYLTSTLAIVGAFSLIIMACSVNDSNSAKTTTNSVGKYQITNDSFANASMFHVIDTETGIVKTYKRDSPTNNFYLTTTTNTQ